MAKYSLKIIQIGNSLGVVLPKDALAELKAGKGDTLMLSRTVEGLRMTPYDNDVSTQVEAGREIMKDYRNTLRVLAK